MIRIGWLSGLGFVCWLFLLTDATAAPADDTTRTGRYTAITAAPTAAQADPLQTLVQLTFPKRVSSTGEALNHLLAGSGYRLASARAADPATVSLQSLPLPQSQRTLGPLLLQDALQTLAGPAYRLITDPVHRLVSFDLAEPYRRWRPEAAWAAPSLPCPDAGLVQRNLTVAFTPCCAQLPESPPRLRNPLPPPPGRHLAVSASKRNNRLFVIGLATALLSASMTDWVLAEPVSVDTAITRSSRFLPVASFR